MALTLAKAWRWWSPISAAWRSPRRTLRSSIDSHAFGGHHHRVPHHLHHSWKEYRHCLLQRAHRLPADPYPPERVHLYSTNPHVSNPVRHQAKPTRGDGRDWKKDTTASGTMLSPLGTQIQEIGGWKGVGSREGESAVSSCGQGERRSRRGGWRRVQIL